MGDDLLFELRLACLLRPCPPLSWKVMGTRYAWMDDSNVVGDVDLIIWLCGVDSLLQSTFRRRPG